MGQYDYAALMDGAEAALDLVARTSRSACNKQRRLKQSQQRRSAQANSIKFLHLNRKRAG